MPLIEGTTDHDILAGTAQADTLSGHDGGDRLEGRRGDYLSTYVERINAVTTAQVNAAARAHLDPQNFLLVMLCTAAGFEGAMKALPGVTTVKVVPYDQDF